MKAIIVKAPGGLDRVERMERPDPGPPGPGTIRVRLHASSLNFHDYGVVITPNRVSDEFNAILREAEASSFHPRAELSCRTAADPPVSKPSKSFGRNGSSTSSDAFLTLSAAVVAAVTRNPWNRSPTCDAFRRIDRSDASSTALSGFGLKLERHI